MIQQFHSYISKTLKAGTQTGICTPLFIAALFTIGIRCKKAKCPSRDDKGEVRKTMEQEDPQLATAHRYN